MFVPYSFRPFWHPNSRAASSVVPSHQDTTELERLSQELDAAERRIAGYVRFTASLTDEIKGYQTIMCRSCKEKILRANLGSTGLDRSTTSSFQSNSSVSAFVSEPSATVSPSDLVGLTRTTSDVQAFPIDFSLNVDEPSSGMASIHPRANADSESLQPPSSVPEATQSEPSHSDWSVEYNPQIKQSLSIHLVNTSTSLEMVYCTKFSRDGKYLAVGLKRGETHVYDMMTGSKSILAQRTATVFYTQPTETPSLIYTVQFGLDNKYIATGDNQGHIMIWEIGRRRVRAIFKHRAFVRSIDFSPDDRFVVSTSHDGSAYIWRIRDGSKRILRHGTTYFMSVTWSSDGRYIATGDLDGLVSIWSARTGRVVAKWQSRADLRSIALTSDRLVSGGRGLQCWDIGLLRDRGRSIYDHNAISVDQEFEFDRHTDVITSVCFSPNNRWVVSGSFDRNVCILDARTGTWLCTLKAHDGYVQGVDFSPAGQYFVSGAEDGRVRFWRYEYIE